jgi:secreted trypsin-like serine protease
MSLNISGSALTTPGIIPRIVGGSNAPITGFPYQVRLLNFCSVAGIDIFNLLKPRGNFTYHQV